MEAELLKFSNILISSDIILKIFQSMLVIFLALSIKDYISNVVAYLSFRFSINIGIGSCVLYDYEEMFIVSATTRVIILENKDMRVCIPIKNFMNNSWTLVKPEN